MENSSPTRHLDRVHPAHGVAAGDHPGAVHKGQAGQIPVGRFVAVGGVIGIYQNEGLKALFGLDAGETLVEGKEYGDFANGTGRVVRSPHTRVIGGGDGLVVGVEPDHPGDALGKAVARHVDGQDHVAPFQIAEKKERVKKMKLAKRSLLGAVVIGVILSLLIVGIDTSCRFQSSRQPIRRALSILEEERLITRRQGSGSRLREPSREEGGSGHSIAVMTTYISDYIFPAGGICMIFLFSHKRQAK